MTHKQKWERINAINIELQSLDAKWDELISEQNQLLLVRTTPSLLSIRLSASHTGRRTTWKKAEDKAREIYALKAIGKDTKEIAIALTISPELVRAYLSPNCKAAMRAGLI